MSNDRLEFGNNDMVSQPTLLMISNPAEPHWMSYYQSHNAS